MATMKDVYRDFINKSASKDIAVKMGITAQGFRHKCLRTQFLTKDEQNIVVSYLKEQKLALDKIIKTVLDLPVRE